LLEDEALRARIGSGAHARVEQAFLGSRHLAQYVDICADLLRELHHNHRLTSAVDGQVVGHDGRTREAHG
jgi:hypothetical protein